MYHYLGSFQLDETAKYDKHSGLRCLCKIDNEYFNCQVDIIDYEKVSPGESAKVKITFLSIHLVASLVQVDSYYQLCEGSRPIGKILIAKDPWSDLKTWISEGEIRKAIVDRIGWTAAGIVMEGGVSTYLMSQDLGLKEWEEIDQVLRVGEIVTVRVEKIDEIGRKIKVSFVDRVS